jgi:hypothetical protein
MPGQYSTRCGHRPSMAAALAEDTPSRLFLCARCRTQVLVCGCCDRGQIYCADGCAREARREAHRAAGRRYRASFRGRLNHATRSERRRVRQKNVTHQGSPPPPDDLVLSDAAVAAGHRPVTAMPAIVERFQGLRSPAARSLRASASCCHWCGRRCPPLVRIDSLRRGRRGWTSSGGTDDYSA